MDDATPRDLSFIAEIPVEVSVEIGRKKMAIKELLQMAPGSIIEFDHIAGEPLNIYVNNCLIGQGEPVIINDKVGIRLTDILTPAQRVQKARK